MGVVRKNNMTSNGCMPLHQYGRKVFIVMFAALASLLNQACSQAGLFVVNAPTYFTSHKVQTDIVYDDEIGQKLDVFTPQEVRTDSPIIVFIYGGRWTDGKKEDYRFVGSFFAENGYITVVPDYRKYPDVKFPSFAQDVAQSIKWVSETYPGRKIVVSGHSAGAHLGAIVVSDERYLQGLGVDLQTLSGFIGLAGPYNFTPEDADLVDMFGPPENYSQMQVTTFIDGSEPPMLLLHGAEDEVVGTFNYEKVAAKVKEQGGSVKTSLIDGLGHVELISSLTWIYRSKRLVDDLILEFLAGKSEKE